MMFLSSSSKMTKKHSLAAKKMNGTWRTITTMKATLMKTTNRSNSLVSMFLKMSGLMDVPNRNRQARAIGWIQNCIIVTVHLTDLLPSSLVLSARDL